MLISNICLLLRYYNKHIDNNLLKKEISMANGGYHEPINELTDDTRDMHRAITSLMEELEAVD